MMRNVKAAALALFAIACTQPTPQPMGSARFAVDALISGANITSVSVEVQPADVSASLVYDAATGKFTGTLNIPSGAQTFTVSVYAGSTLVGTGSASATIVAGQTMNVAITVLDGSGPPPVPPNRPYITSLVVPATVDAAAEATFAATAVDPQGDTLAYAWSQSCSAEAGTFGTAPAASATWTAPGSATTCQITVTATSPSGLFDARTATVAVAAVGGGVDVTVDFVPQPVIDHIWLQTVAAPVNEVCSVLRDDASATCPGTLPPASVWTVAFTFQNGAQGASATLTDNCGGSAVPDPLVASSIGATGAAFGWTAPAGAGVCILEARVTSGGLIDTFPIEVVLADDAPPPPPPATTHSVSGTVRTSDGAAMAGVTVSIAPLPDPLDPQPIVIGPTVSATTDANGNYAIAGLPSGSYRITPTLTGLTFSPTYRLIEVTTADASGQDFASVPAGTWSLGTSLGPWSPTTEALYAVWGAVPTTRGPRAPPARPCTGTAPPGRA